MQLQMLRDEKLRRGTTGARQERLQCSNLCSTVCEGLHRGVIGPRKGRLSCSYSCSGVCGKLRRGMTGVRTGALTMLLLLLRGM